MSQDTYLEAVVPLPGPNTEGGLDNRVGAGALPAPPSDLSRDSPVLSKGAGQVRGAGCLPGPPPDLVPTEGRGKQAGGVTTLTTPTLTPTTLRNIEQMFADRDPHEPPHHHLNAAGFVPPIISPTSGNSYVPLGQLAPLNCHIDNTEDSPSEDDLTDNNTSPIQLNNTKKDPHTIPEHLSNGGDKPSRPTNLGLPRLGPPPLLEAPSRPRMLPLLRSPPTTSELLVTPIMEEQQQQPSDLSITVRTSQHSLAERQTNHLSIGLNERQTNHLSIGLNERQTHNLTKGQAHNLSIGQTERQTHNLTIGQTHNLPPAQTERQTHNLTAGQTERLTHNLTIGQTERQTHNLTLGQNERQTHNIPTAQAERQAQNLTLGQTERQTLNLPMAQAERQAHNLTIGQLNLNGAGQLLSHKLDMMDKFLKAVTVTPVVLQPANNRTNIVEQDDISNSGRDSLVVDSDSPKNIGGRRPTYSESDMMGGGGEDVTRKVMRRERNKQAAARCRKRRLDLTTGLQGEVDQWEDKVRSLKEELLQLESQKKGLEAVLRMHEGPCKMSKIDNQESK